MENYNNVKAQAAALLVESKKIEGMVAAHRYNDANQAILELLNKVLSLFDNYPNTIATYVIASNIIQSMTRSSEKMVNENEAAPQLPFLMCHILFTQSVDFLLKYKEDQNCANLLLSDALSDFFTFSEYLQHVPNAHENQDILEYYVSITKILATLTTNLKSFIPNSPLMNQAVNVCASLRQQGMSFEESNLTMAFISEEKDRMDTLIHQILPSE